jgi:hypothetical protein
MRFQVNLLNGPGGKTGEILAEPRPLVMGNFFEEFFGRLGTTFYVSFARAG